MTTTIPSKKQPYADDRTKDVLNKSGAQTIEAFLKQKQEEFLRKGRVAGTVPRSTAADWRRGD